MISFILDTVAEANELIDTKLESDEADEGDEIGEIGEVNL